MSMQRIPVDAGEVETFTPAALSHVETPPVFRLRAVTRRQREAMEYHLIREGLRRYTEEEIREASIDELCRLWACGPEDEQPQRVRAFWQAVDDYLEHVRDTMKAHEGDAAPDIASFDHPDLAEISALTARLQEASPLLRSMATENIRFDREFPRIAAAHTIIGWTGIATPMVRDAGVLSVDCIADMKDELTETHDEAGKLAWVQLYDAVMKRIYLQPSAEKNSNSPAPSQQTPAPTKDNGQASQAGKSPASEPSTETLEG